MELKFNILLIRSSVRKLSPRMMMLISFAGMSVVNYAFSFAAGWLLLPGDFGLLAFAQTLLTLIGLILNSGLPWSLTASLVEANEEDRAKRVRGSALANLGLSLLFALILLVLFMLGPLKPGLETWPVALLVAGTLPLISLITIMRAALQGSERFGALAALWLIETGVKALSGVGLVMAGFGAAGAIAGFFIGSLVASVVGLVFLVRLLRISPFGGIQAPSFSHAGAMFSAMLGMALLLNMDMLALKLFSGADRAVVGRYQAGIILANTPYYILTATFPVLFTQIVRKKTIRASVGLAAETLRLALIFLIPVEALLALFPQFFLRLLFPATYLAGAPALRLLALANAAFLLVAVLSTTFQATGKALLPGRTLLAITAIEAVLLAVFVPVWNSIGAASIFLSATLTALIILGWRYLLRIERRSIRSALGWFGKYILAAGLGITVGVIVLLLFKIDWLAIGLGGITYLVGLQIFGLVSVSALLNHPILKQLTESQRRAPAEER
jgi:O-antigen/teichoic acid export membrane protein